MIRGLLPVVLLALVPLAGPQLRAQEPAGAQSADSRVLRDGPIEVHYAPEQRRLAIRLLDAVRQRPTLPALPDDALRSGPPIRIHLASSPVEFDSLTGGRAPEWGAGVAIPEAGRIVLPTFASERVAPHALPRVLRHELAHIALHRYLDPLRIPRWFNEGYARWAAGEWSLESAWRLRVAFLMRDSPSLDSIALAWPRAEPEAQAAYLLATSAVAYLVENGGGERGLEIFLERWKDEGSMERAMRRTFGLTSGQFEEDWQREVRSRYGWPFLLADAAIFWLFAALVLLILVIVRRRRDRQRLEHLRATEPPDRPAFWLGEELDPWEGGVGDDVEESDT